MPGRWLLFSFLFSKGSFGTLDEVSKTVLPEADGVSSRMVNSYTSKSSYVYDYVVDQEGRPEKHIKVRTQVLFAWESSHTLHASVYHRRTNAPPMTKVPDPE